MQLKCTHGIQNMLVSDNNSHSKVSVKVSILLFSTVAAVVKLQGPGYRFTKGLTQNLNLRTHCALGVCWSGSQSKLHIKQHILNAVKVYKRYTKHACFSQQ